MEQSTVKLLNKHPAEDVYSDALMNLALLDPPRYGWSAIGGVIDVCPPHEKARRSSTAREYLALSTANTTTTTTTTAKTNDRHSGLHQSTLLQNSHNSIIPRKRKASVSVDSSSSTLKTTNLVDLQTEPRRMEYPREDHHHHPQQQLSSVVIGQGLAATENFDLDHDELMDVVIKREEDSEQNGCLEEKKPMNDGTNEKDEKERVDREDTREKRTDGKTTEDTGKKDEKLAEEEEMDGNQIVDHQIKKKRKEDGEKQKDEKQGSPKQTDEKQVSETHMDVEQGVSQQTENIPNKQAGENHKESDIPMDEKKKEEEKKEIKGQTKGEKATITNDNSKTESSDSQDEKDITLPSVSSKNLNDQDHTNKTIDNQTTVVGKGVDGEDFGSNKTSASDMVVVDALKDANGAILERNTRDALMMDNSNGTMSEAKNVNDTLMLMDHDIDGTTTKGLDDTATDGIKESEKAVKLDSVEPNPGPGTAAAATAAAIVIAPLVSKEPKIRDKPDKLTLSSTTPTTNTFFAESVNGFITLPSKNSDGKTHKDTDNNDGDTTEDEDEEEYTITEKNSKTNEPKALRVNAVKRNGTLNIHAYHRGIASNEPRDTCTGELLCKTNPTDTNHKWDEPNLKLKVTVEFPLDDPVVTEDEDDSENDSVQSGKNHDSDSDYNESVNKKDRKLPKRSKRRRLDRHGINSNMDLSSLKGGNHRPTTALEHRRQREHKLSLLPKFRDDIEWDLSDPTTPTPMIYAADIAAEFGLSLNQMLDLAAGIQRQIDEFCRDELADGAYRIPIASRDPSMAKRDDTCNPPGFVLAKTLHGGHCASSIASLTKPSIPQNDTGVTVTRAKGSKNNTIVSRVRLSGDVVSSAGGSCKSASAPRVKKSPPIRMRGNTSVSKHLLPKHGVAEGKQAFVDEVLARAKKEFICKNNKQGCDGSFSIQANWVCHICHQRKNVGCVFPCGNDRHAYCDMHCSNRLGFTISQVREGFTLGYCPICCLQCACAKCQRQLNAVVSVFEKKCHEQGVAPKDAKMVVLPLCMSSTDMKLEKMKSRTMESSPPSSRISKPKQEKEKMKSRTLECSSPSSRISKPKQEKDSPIVVDSHNEQIVKRSPRTPPTSRKTNDINSKNEPNAKKLLCKTRSSTSNINITRPTSDTSKEKEQEFEIDDTSLPTSSFALPLSHVPKPTATSITTPKSNSGSKKSKRVSNMETQQESTTSPNLHPKSRRDQKGGLAQASDVPSGTVTKVLACEFPSEIFNEKNLDPSLKDDYLTVFTPSGSHVTARNPSIIEMIDETKLKNVTSEQEEDGNIDYCLICNQSGGIICCDKCPRGFHGACLNIQGKELPDPWECPRCKTDETEQEGDVMTVNDETYQKIAKALRKLQDDESFQEKALLLGKTYEMLTYLMNYDFGHVFSEPVELPGYRAVIKIPMDLGTICTNILKATYLSRITKSKKIRKEPITDMIILDVLKDIERVWHNCFSYNYEGSAVYRMAEVQRKRYIVIRSRNIDEHLQPFVLQELEKFVAACEMKRRKITAAEAIPLPKSNHAFPAAPPSGQTKKAVGILDPDINMLVKQYSTLGTAVKIAMYMSLKLNHNSGMKNISITAVKERIRNSSHNPSLLIFGYRWLFVQDLRDGNFSVDSSTSLIRKSNSAEACRVNSFVYEKVCLTTGATLATFHTMPDAYDDWIMSLKYSIDTELDPSLVTFKRDYLDKSRTINNALWKTMYSENNEKGSDENSPCEPIDGNNAATAQVLESNDTDTSEQNSRNWHDEQFPHQDPTKPLDIDTDHPEELGEHSSFEQSRNLSACNKKLELSTQRLETSESLIDEGEISSTPAKDSKSKSSSCPNSKES